MCIGSWYQFGKLLFVQHFKKLPCEREPQAAAAAAAAALLTACKNFNRTESSAEQRAIGTVSRYVTLCCCPHTRRNCSSDLAS